MLCTEPCVCVCIDVSLCVDMVLRCMGCGEQSVQARGPATHARLDTLPSRAPVTRRTFGSHLGADDGPCNVRHGSRFLRALVGSQQNNVVIASVYNTTQCSVIRVPHAHSTAASSTIHSPTAQVRERACVRLSCVKLGAS